jgi:hypothetical protein
MAVCEAVSIKGIVLIRRNRKTLAITVIAPMIVFSSGAFGKAPQPSSGEQQAIVDVVSTLFAAAHDDDLAKFNSVIAPGFYMVDNGARFDGDAIMTLMRNLHSAGKRFEWHVTEPDVHIEGGMAWIAYVNRGSITTGSVTSDQQWLESAILRKQSARWKIVFISSARASPAPPAQPK